LHRLGRLDELLANGQLDALIQSLSAFSEKLAVLGAHAQGDSMSLTVLESAGADLRPALAVLLDRQSPFGPARGPALRILRRAGHLPHRAPSPLRAGSDRAAEKWKDDYAIDGASDLDLHHLYRPWPGW